MTNKISFIMKYHFSTIFGLNIDFSIAIHQIWLVTTKFTFSLLFVSFLTMIICSLGFVSVFAYLTIALWNICCDKILLTLTNIWINVHWRGKSLRHTIRVSLESGIHLLIGTTMTQVICRINSTSHEPTIEAVPKEKLCKLLWSNSADPD